MFGITRSSTNNKENVGFVQDHVITRALNLWYTKSSRFTDVQSKMQWQGTCISVLIKSVTIKKCTDTYLIYCGGNEILTAKNAKKQPVLRFTLEANFAIDCSANQIAACSTHAVQFPSMT